MAKMSLDLGSRQFQARLANNNIDEVHTHRKKGGMSRLKNDDGG